MPSLHEHEYVPFTPRIARSFVLASSSSEIEATTNEINEMGAYLFHRGNGSRVLEDQPEDATALSIPLDLHGFYPPLVLEDTTIPERDEVFILLLPRDEEEDHVILLFTARMGTSAGLSGVFLLTDERWEAYGHDPPPMIEAELALLDLKLQI